MANGVNSNAAGHLKTRPRYLSFWMASACLQSAIYFWISASLFPAKKSTTVFETVPVTMSGEIAASRLIFNSFARSATVSNLGLLLQFSISMIVRTLKKLRRLAEENPDANWLIMNGNRLQIKRKQFEKVIDELEVI